MNKRAWIIGITLVLVFILVANLRWILTPFNIFPLHEDTQILENLTPEQLQELSTFFAVYIRGKSIISFVNSILLTYLLYLQIKVYRTAKTTFSLGLLLFTSALLLYTVTMNPIAIWFAGFNRVTLARSFNFLPDLFTTIASVVLIYLSRQ